MDANRRNGVEEEGKEEEDMRMSDVEEDGGGRRGRSDRYREQGHVKLHGLLIQKCQVRSDYGNGMSAAEYSSYICAVSITVSRQFQAPADGEEAPGTKFAGSESVADPHSQITQSQPW